MAICLPGIASSVNRADTSATRPGAVRDDDELDERDDEEDHEPDDDVAADDERTEGSDHAAGIAAREHRTRRRDVEADPDERDDEQQ